MTVYVDELRTYPRAQTGLKSEEWCHLTADDVTELHAFAGALALKRSWFQDPGPRRVSWHYDITRNKRRQAVRLGAVEINFREMAALLDQRRRARDAGSGAEWIGVLGAVIKEAEA